uniref:Uncharacterized protein n=1 Tax=Magallana gigas TaxID=29159 RepID=K1PQ09_MAGGI
MNFSALRLLTPLLLLVQLCTSENRYCQEAVESVTTVGSCPTTKAGWDAAAHCTEEAGMLQKGCDALTIANNVKDTQEEQNKCQKSATDTLKIDRYKIKLIIFK